MKNWYINMTVGQRKFVWVVSILLLPFWPVGVPTTLLLIYLHLGAKA